MEINVTINCRKTFDKVEAGETFYYEPSGCMWIKLRYPLFDGNEDPYNAIALDDGTPSYFEANDKMLIIPTKLVNA